MPPLRRATVIGAGPRALSLAGALARAGVEVDLAGLTSGQARTMQRTADALPDHVRIVAVADADLEHAETICLALPARDLPSVLAAQAGRIPRGAGLLVAGDGMVPPLGTLPSAFAAERCTPSAVAVLAGPGSPGTPIDATATVVASAGRGFARQIAEPLRSAGLDVSISADVAGVELASCATDAAALAAALAAPRAGAAAAGAAAGKVFAEIDAVARARGSRPGTFAGVAGAGALVAAVMDAHPVPGLPASGAGSTPPFGDDLAPAAEVVPLLLDAARRARVRAPVLDGLAAVVEGRMTPDQWAEAVTGAPVGVAPLRAAPAAVDAVTP